MILSTVHQVLRSRVGSCWYSLTEKGGRIPQNMELGTLMQTAPPYFAIFLNFKHRRLLAVNAAKRYSQNTSFQVTFSGKGLSPLPVSFPVGGGFTPIHLHLLPNEVLWIRPQNSSQICATGHRLSPDGRQCGQLRRRLSPHHIHRFKSCRHASDDVAMQPRTSPPPLIFPHL